METFKIKYKGEKIDAVKTNHGGYSATLPLRKGDRGAVYTETVSRVENGWRFSSTESIHPDYYFDVYFVFGIDFFRFLYQNIRVSVYILLYGR